jgi:predicted PurR-regulated permease PerM
MQGDFMMRFIRRPLAWLLSAMLAILPIVPAQAAMIGTDQIVNQVQSGLDRNQLQQMLDQEEAQQQLLSWGVSPDAVKARISSLTDAELAVLNQEIDKLNAGGTNVLGILLVIFIVFVITDVIGATDIFPFIHPVK